MHSLGVQAAFVVLLMFAVIVKAEDGNVEFWRGTVTLTCPENGSWHDNKINVANGTTYEFKFERQSQLYCEYDDGTNKIKYLFYVKGKTCENCFELDAFMVGTAIVVDLMGTVFVMMMVYRCTRKKGSDGPTQTSKRPPAPVRSGPTVPSRDYGYEALNPHTRAQDPYSTVNRMG